MPCRLSPLAERDLEEIWRRASASSVTPVMTCAAAPANGPVTRPAATTIPPMRDATTIVPSDGVLMVDASPESST